MSTTSLCMVHINEFGIHTHRKYIYSVVCTHISGSIAHYPYSMGYIFIGINHTMYVVESRHECFSFLFLSLLLWKIKNPTHDKI